MVLCQGIVPFAGLGYEGTSYWAAGGDEMMAARQLRKKTMAHIPCLTRSGNIS